jgi:serine/threonine-protein kinase
MEDANEIVRLLPEAPAGYLVRGDIARDAKQYDQATEDFSKVIELMPKSAIGFVQRATVRDLQQNHAGAVSDYEEALKREPGDEQSLNNLAWMLATCPQDKVRNGKRAVELARQSAEKTRWRNPSVLDTLAAAEAENGDFAAAARWQTRVLELAGETKSRPEMEARLKLYQDKKAYREERKEE